MNSRPEINRILEENYTGGAWYIDNKAIDQLESLIAQEAGKLANKRIEAFAERVVAEFKMMPRHRPSNTSLWDGVQMDRAIRVIDTELQKLDKGDSQ